jgi:hypothetical protein
MDQDQITPQVTLRPVCSACATGYHDEVLSIHEQCGCPCHGTEVPKVAKSIADDCRSIADDSKSAQLPCVEQVARVLGSIADCRRGVDV